MPPPPPPPQPPPLLYYHSFASHNAIGCKIESVKVVLMLHKHIYAMYISYSRSLTELMQLKSDIEKRTAKYPVLLIVSS